MKRARASSVAKLLARRNIKSECKVCDKYGHAYPHIVVKPPNRDGISVAGRGGYLLASKQPDVCHVNAAGPGGRTAIRLAALLGFGDVVSVLLECGANVTAASGYEKVRAADALLHPRTTVFHDIASADVPRDKAEQRKRQIASLNEFLHRALAEIGDSRTRSRNKSFNPIWDEKYSLLDERRRSSLHYAAARGNDELLEHLLSHLAADPDHEDEVNRVDALGWTPLAIAVHHGHTGSLWCCCSKWCRR